ncbi:hypothetical protein CTI12_AA202830 [Artemisia annua]|uniref:Nucleotide-binding alpha-beta plait domain-containing protein n=1 Tax=Artemisia annua TaxID=35608 RepID=A0A2U1P237_ARTAN|nr:hypothetical protein CTI12_AA202830 [Artemisia annua]
MVIRSSGRMLRKIPLDVALDHLDPKVVELVVQFNGLVILIVFVGKVCFELSAGVSVKAMVTGHGSVQWLVVLIINVGKVCFEVLAGVSVEGHVIDSFIPERRSKAGKRFGFVRFINVFDVDRLVGNLCTVWIGNHRIHANVARFSRPLATNIRPDSNKTGMSRMNLDGNNKDIDWRDKGSSYAYVVKGGPQLKEIGALINLKMVMRNEAFTDFDLKYLGGLWIMIGFKSIEAKEKFLLCETRKSWFSQIVQASSEFIVDGRITWVDVEGVPLKVWSFNTFNKIAAKWGSLLNVKEADEDSFHSKRLCVHTTGLHNIFESFKLIFKGNVYWVRAKEVSGWTPDFDDQCEEETDSENEQFDDDLNGDIGGSDNEQNMMDEASGVRDTLAKDELLNGRKDVESNVVKDIRDIGGSSHFN